MSEKAKEHLKGHVKRRTAAHLHPVNVVHHDEASLGERVADRMAAGIGSWWFLIIQSFVIFAWVVLNVIILTHKPFDPYPFFLLNFSFSMQAAFTGPVLLLAGKRQAEKDRLMLEHAAAEAEASERQTLDILDEIEGNTETTIRILERVRARREGSAISH